MSKQDVVGRASLWNNEDSVSGGKPVMKGSIDIRGIPYRISLWPSDSRSPNAPTLTGVVENDLGGSRGR